jgi:PKD repeat protein
MAVGLVLAISVAGRARPAAANSPSAQLYATANLGARGLLDRFNLASVISGGATPNNNPTLGNAPLGPVAVNVTGTKAVFGAATPPAGILALPPAIDVVDVATGTVTGTTTTQTPTAIAPDPTNPAMAYVLEGSGSSGQIDRVNVATSPPTDTLLVTGSNFAGNICCSLTSLAISPDGKTLFVGEEGDGFAGIGVVPIGNPSAAFEWQWPQGRDSVFLDSVADLVVAPDGRFLYATGPGFNQQTGGREGEVFALSLPIKNASQAPAWSRGLTSGTLVPTCMTINPNGGSLEIGGNGGLSTPSGVQTLSAGGSPAGFKQVPGMATNANGGQGLRSIAFTPDGQTILVAGTDGAGSSDDAIIPLRASNLAAGAKTHLPVRSNQLVAQSLAITPDQAPALGFSVSVSQAGLPTTFTAGVLPAEFGPATSFAWTFGDGGTGSGKNPSHTYAAAGTYSVTLTETDGLGFTAVPPVVVAGPGQTPYWRANLGAAQTISVPAAPSTNTTGTTAPSTSTSTTGPGQSATTTTVPGQHVPGTPSLILNPAVGTPGTIVTVTGTGFLPNTPVTVSWSVSTGSVVIVADSSGNLPPSQLLILTPDVLGPRFAQASSTPQATAPFLVVPSTSEPGGDDGGLLFRSEGP